MSNSKNRIRELDALRGAAALLVVLFHFTMGRDEGKLGFKLGTTGVDLFFMISGFVIFMSIQNIQNLKVFAVNRFCRLYPTYWTVVTFTFLLIILRGIFLNSFSSIHFFQYLGNLTMFQFYMRIENLDGPYWTLIIEMLFYIIISVFFHFKLLKYIPILGFLYLLLISTLLIFFKENSIFSFIVSAIPLLKFLPLFLSGILFYNIWIQKMHKVQNYFLIIGCLFCQILMFKFTRSSIFINQIEYASMLFIYFILFGLFVTHRLSFIISPITIFLGKISFALYLVHQYLANEILIPFLTNSLHLNFWIASFGIALPIVILIAYFITNYIEMPLGQKLKKYLYAKFT